MDETLDPTTDPNLLAQIHAANAATNSNMGLIGAPGGIPLATAGAGTVEMPAPPGVGGMPPPPGQGAPPQQPPDMSNFTGAPLESPAQVATIGGRPAMDGNGAAPAPKPGAGAAPAAPFSGPQKMKETETSTETRKAGKLAEAEFGNFGKAFVKNQTAQEDLAREDAHYKALELGEANQIRGKRILEEEQRQASISHEIRKRQSEIDRVTNEYNNTTIDSNRVYGDGQTGNKIMAGIGLALGALSEGLTGKDAGVVDIITKAIERDIDVQKANLAKMGNSVNMMRGGLQDYMTIMRDETAAKDLEMARQLDHVANRFAEIRSKSPDKAIQARSAEQEMNFRAKALEFRQATDVVIQKNATKTVDQVKQLGNFSDGTKDKVNAAKQGLDTLDKIEELSAKIQTGKLESWEAGMREWLGVADGDTRSFQAALSRMQSNLIKELSGATASEDEARRIAGQMMQFQDNPAAFRQLLNDVRNRTISTIQNERQSARDNNQNDPYRDMDKRVAKYNFGVQNPAYKRGK